MTRDPPAEEDLIHRHVREMLNAYHYKCGYRTDLIEELTAHIREVLRREARRPSY